MNKLLLINWKQEQQKILMDIFDDSNYQLSFTFNIQQTLNVLTHERIDLIIIEKKSYSIDSLCELLEKIQSICPEIPLIILNENFIHNKINIIRLVVTSAGKLQISEI